MPLWSFYWLGCAIVCALVGLLFEERATRVVFGIAALLCLLGASYASQWLYP